MKNTSKKMERRSPVHLPGKPVKIESRDGWPVVLEYADEGDGPRVVDLSHCPRWDIQGAALSAAVPKGVPLPAAPGEVELADEVLVGRTGMRQAFLWTFGGEPPAMGPACTEATEGSACIALLGRDALRITEKLTALDLGNPASRPPFLRLGPFAHVTAQMIVLGNGPDSAAVLVACSRGFGHDLVHAVLQAGEEFGLRPAGEKRLLETLADSGLGVPRSDSRNSSKVEKAKPAGPSRSKKAP